MIAHGGKHILRLAASVCICREAKPSAVATQKCIIEYEVLWIVGDSLTKQWRSIEPQINGIPEVFTTYFGNYSAAILGVGGAAHKLSLSSVVSL